jgi:mono/diheme cytochrome c family protein
VRSSTTLGALTLLLATGCTREAEPAHSPAKTAAPAKRPPAGSPETVITEAARAEAREVFSHRCSACHGPQGEGNGPAAAGLDPPPRNFHDQAWQAQVTDPHIEKIIAYGGTAVGKGPAMPPNPDLVDRPVVPALRELVRSFGQ